MGIKLGRDAGTIIDDRPSEYLVLSTVSKASMLTIIGHEHMMHHFARVLDEFAHQGIYPLFITETSSLGEISIGVEAGSLKAVLGLVHSIDIGAEECTIETHEGLSLLSIIGSAMKGKVGTAAKIFDTLAEANTNIIAIAQSASERNISVVVPSDSLERAARALHEKFVG